MSQQQTAARTTAVDWDVIIAGGGMVGLSQALALQQAGFAVRVIEAKAECEHSQRPGHDPRFSALSAGSWQYLQTLGIGGGALADTASAIAEVRVFNQRRFGLTRISARQSGLEYLGQVVANATLTDQLREQLSAHSADWLQTQTQVTGYTPQVDRVQVHLDGKHGEQTQTARLLIAADGSYSPLREAAQIPIREHDYQQTAIVTTARPQKPHRHIAYECFTSGGPLAVLPAGAERVSVVWVVRSSEVDARIAQSDNAFADDLGKALGGRLGRSTDLAPRSVYPLSLKVAERITDQRFALVGNAAHSLHPVAGQGFNLCLRDVRDLTRALQADRGAWVDPGDAERLACYAQSRQSDYDQIIQLTDGLVRGFSLRFPGLATLRGAGLCAFDGLLPFKRKLVQATLGTG